MFDICRTYHYRAKFLVQVFRLDENQRVLSQSSTRNCHELGKRGSDVVAESDRVHEVSVLRREIGKLHWSKRIHCVSIRLRRCGAKRRPI